MRDLPYHRYLGLDIQHAEAGRSRVVLQVHAQNQNMLNVLHGGVICSVLDVAAYAALISVLAPDQAGVTHDIHVSMLRPATSGTTVVFEGEVVRSGKSLAFVDARATIDGQLIASARITKSLIASPAQ